LGLPLGQHLVAQGYKVKGSTTRSERLDDIRKAGLHPYLLKIDRDLSPEMCDDFFESDLLILNIPPGRRDPDVEDLYPIRIQQAMTQAQLGGIAHCLFVGSTGIYGNVNGPVDEYLEPEPSTRSGRALLTVERYLDLLQNPSITILRMGGLVGGQRKMGRFLAGRQDLPNGKAPVNLVHLDDCIGVINEVIRQQAWDEVFNVVADEHPSKEELYVAEARALGLEPPKFRPDGDGQGKWVRNDKLKHALDYRFKYPDPRQFP